MSEGGQAQPLSEAALFHLLGVLKDNSCSSARATPSRLQKALAEMIPCTIGMSGSITDGAAIAFTASFYRGLGFGRSIQEAFDLGKNSLMNLQVPEDQQPRLYCRKGTADAAKVVLVGPSTAPSRRPGAGGERNRVAMVEKGPGELDV